MSREATVFRLIAYPQYISFVFKKNFTLVAILLYEPFQVQFLMCPLSNIVFVQPLYDARGIQYC